MSTDLPRQFGPDYTLLKLLARGGMGEIYLARSTGITGFEKYYAVKKLLKKFANDTDVGSRFIDEAKLGARLQHPNIVQVYDLGRVQEELFMATEFVDGFDLRRVLRFCHERKKRIPLDIALFIVREVLSGLAYAHRQVDAAGRSIDLIHRDISPQNVLVSFEGEVKITDFGLAKSTQRSGETQANVLLGNFGYMSPEQARGFALDVRTDVYSSGVVLFELCTGTKRFVEDNPLRLLELVARPTPIMPSDRVTGMPATIDRIYARATAFVREERYQSAEAFRDDVNAALHRLNTKASRENVAQFLNHLFLGGAAPPPVDPDLLDKSVAMRVRDLHEQSVAFHKTPADDLSDRGLHAFSDDAPQTGSHAVMRAARVGDALTHTELTGEAAVGPPVEQGSAGVVPQPPAPQPSLSSAAPVDSASAAPSITDVLLQFSPSPPALVAAQVASGDLTPLDIPVVVLPLVDLPQAPPESDPAVKAVVAGQLVEPAEDVVPPAALDLVVEVASESVSAHRPDTHPHQPEAAQVLELSEAPAEEVTKPGAPMPAPPSAASSQTARSPPAPPPMPQAAKQKKQRAPQASQGQAKVVTTIGPKPTRPEPSLEEPSIVVAMDLEPHEPTVVGPMPSPRSRNALREQSDDGGFGDGNDSIIIELATDSEADAPPEATIRPAAQPLGRTVVATVAEPSKRRTRESGARVEPDPDPGLNESQPPRKR